MFELRRHSLGGEGRHKQGTLAGPPDDRNQQASQKSTEHGTLHRAQTPTREGILCYGPRLVRRLSTSGTTRCAVAIASLAVVVAVPVALGADSSSLHARAAELHAEEASAGAQASAAVRTLYALEAELSRARAEVAATESRRLEVVDKRASTRRQLALAQSSMRVSERRLAELVRTSYKQNEADPLVILLGAASLDEALTGLENLDRVAGENRRVLESARAARARLLQVDARLDAREAELRRASEAAQGRLRSLEAKVAERAAYIDSLRQAQRLSARRVATLEAQARAAERRSAELQVSSRRLPAAPLAGEAAAPITASPAAPTGGRRLTVASLGYSLRGRTASGLPVGTGIVAVDPNVIPLGTRMVVPGYGEAVAADTGSAIRGAMIDLWFPTVAAARRWGRRTVVITLK